jgi:predicted nucleic acid-binding protein
MLLMDGNLLVYADREDTTDHQASSDWGEDTIKSGSAYGVSELVRSGFLRVVTPPNVLLTRSLLAPNGSKQESWYGRLLDPASRQQWLGREPCHISR